MLKTARPLICASSRICVPSRICAWRVQNVNSLVCDAQNLTETGLKLGRVCAIIARSDLEDEVVVLVRLAFAMCNSPVPKTVAAFPGILPRILQLMLHPNRNVSFEVSWLILCCLLSRVYWMVYRLCLMGYRFDAASFLELTAVSQLHALVEGALIDLECCFLCSLHSKHAHLLILCMRSCQGCCAVPCSPYALRWPST